MVTIEALQKWTLADDSQRMELEMAKAAAESYLAAAGVPAGDSPTQDMAILALATYFFEQRAPGANNEYAPLPPALRPLILQLQTEGARE